MSGTLDNPARGLAEGLSDEHATSPLHIALVSRRLWPLAGESETSVLQLADRLHQGGAAPTLVTARWQPHWAERTTLRGMPVVRLPMPATPGWRMLRYVYALSRYLRQHRNAYDAVVVSGLRAEAYCALSSLRGSGIPVILRASEAGPYGEVAWQKQTRFGNRIAGRCKEAAAIVAASGFVADELHAFGYPNQRIHIRPPFISGDATPRNEETRQAARSAVAAVNHDLHVVGGAPVMLCISPLQRERGLDTLIRAWLPIQHRWPHARLWIIGDGPEREPLFQLICDLDVRYRAVLPGAFDCWDDLFRAADVLVAPAPQPSTSLVLQEALASGVPVIASDQAEHRGLISPERTGLFYSPTDKGALTHCLTRLLDNPQHRIQLGLAARDAHFSEPRNDESLWLREFLAAQRHVR
jgi:glycosyltransferase involved in cell wall biosynthesis